MTTVCTAEMAPGWLLGGDDLTRRLTRRFGHNVPCAIQGPRGSEFSRLCGAERDEPT